MAGLLLMTLSLLPIGLATSLQGVFTLICCFYLGIDHRRAGARNAERFAGRSARAAAIWALAAGSGAGRRVGLYRRRLDVRYRTGDKYAGAALVAARGRRFRYAAGAVLAVQPAAQASMLPAVNAIEIRPNRQQLLSC